MILKNATLAVLLWAATIASPLAANEITFGLGAETSEGNDASFSFDWHGDAIKSFRSTQFRLGIASEVQSSGDAWIGIGGQMNIPLKNDFRIDLGLHGGLYSQGSSGQDLGGDFQFRSRLTVLKFVRPDLGIGLSIQHKSNAGLDDDNPGSETLHLVVVRRF